MDERRDRLRIWYKLTAWTMVVIFLFILLSCGANRQTKDIRVLKTKDTVPVTIKLSPMPTIPEVITAATSTAVAVRVNPPTTVPPPTAADICNGLVYDFEEMENPMVCFRAIAQEIGLQHWQIAEPWIFDVIAKESGGCPFLRGGSSDIPVGCEPRIKGTRDDTGFGQATRSYWGPTGKLCTVYGVCSSWQILESPYHSMLYSVIYVAMLDGRYGYCDYEGAPRYHNCGLAPGATTKQKMDWRLT